MSHHDHHRRAGELLDNAEDFMLADSTKDRLIAIAQVHATLAVAEAINDLEGHLFDSETLPVRLSDKLRD